MKHKQSLRLKKFLIKSFYLILLSSKIDFAVGGQALIEGVMMRSPNHITIAIRKKDGTIVSKQDKFHSLTQRYKFLNIPLLRGVINLFEMMIVGTKALNFSANEFVDDGEDAAAPAESKNQGKDEHNLGGLKAKLMKVFEFVAFGFSIALALGFSLLLFKFIPLSITEYLRAHFVAIQNNYFLFNVIDGSIKTTMFVGYIGLIGLVPSFARIFQYHGAEHKSIFTYEKNLSLDADNAKKQSRFHPRCGTSFVIIVFAISVLVYSLVPRHEVFLINFARRVVFLPLIAGIAYEALKLSAKHIDHIWVKALITPGLWFQRLTTKEPDKAQLEIGLASLQKALELEKELVIL